MSQCRARIQNYHRMIYVLRHSRGLDKLDRKLLFDLDVVLQTDRKTDYNKKFSFILKLLIGSGKVYSYFGGGYLNPPIELSPRKYELFFLKLNVEGSLGPSFPPLPSSTPRGLQRRSRKIEQRKATLKKEKKNERYRNRFINLKYKVERFFSVKSFESFDKVIL